MWIFSRNCKHSHIFQKKSVEKRKMNKSKFPKMDDFSPQLGMRKTLEIRHFSMEFHSEGDF